MNAVKVKLLGSEIEVVLKRYTENVEAYQLYLQGRYHHNKYTRDGFIKGIEYFKAAIAVDSTYALAYSGISFCYLTLWYYQWLPADESLPLAVEAARKSIELDGNIAESYLATGRMKLHYEWKVAEAEVDFKKALAINPNSAECHIQLSMCAALLGNNKVALEHAHTAINLDPFSLMTRWMASAALMSADIQASIENGKKLIDLNSEFFFGHWVLGESLLFTGKYAEGLEELELAAQLEKGSMALSSLGGAYGSAGDKSKALEVIKQLESLPGKGNKDIGDVYMSIGEIDRALEYYEKAVKLREPWMLWTGMGVRNLPSFQQDPRIRDFLDRTGIPY